MLSKEFTYKLHNLSYVTKKALTQGIQIVFFIASLCAIAMMIYEYGYNFSSIREKHLIEGYNILLRIFLYGNLINLALNPQLVWQEKGFWLEIIILAVLLFILLTQNQHHFPNDQLLYKVNHILTHTLLIFISAVHLSKNIVATLQRHVKPEMMFTYSFLTIIIAGAFLLMLPNAHHGQLRFIDALFTSASAVCVTGLTVVDTSTTFTSTGLVILLLLIQIGGVGVMTFTSFIAMSFFSQNSFQDQMALKSILNEESMNNIFKTLFYTLLTTITIEAAGTYILWRQIADVPPDVIPDKLFFAIFHSISGFCNAGFSTLKDNLYNPAVRHLFGFQTWLGALIILGGIGFPIVFNYGKLFNHKFRNIFYSLTGSSKRIPSHLRIVSTTTRIAILATSILIVAGTALFLFSEYHNTLANNSFGEKIALSFFGAVTPRTAGFNNLPIGSFHSSTIFLTLLLMWIGASPMSTGGGIKTTTFVVALKSIYSVITGKKRVELAKRQLTQENVNRAGVIIFLSVFWIGLTTILLSFLEPQGSVVQILFEVTSALSTVGLTLDFTPTLSDTGKIIISLTMFVGRVGLITILSGILPQKTSTNYTYADENVIL